jgi:hypothetical protein
MASVGIGTEAWSGGLELLLFKETLWEHAFEWYHAPSSGDETGKGVVDYEHVIATRHLV